MAATPDALPACLNCAQPLPLPRPRFCGHCGQETNLRAPTLGEFAQQFGGAYFSTEGALWRTLKLLLTKPGALTIEYFAGRRKHYVLPLRLYLTVSVVVLLLARIVASNTLQTEVSPRVDPGRVSLTLLSTGPSLRVGVEKGRYYCEGLPEAMCKRIERRLVADGRFRPELQQLGERFITNASSAMFVLLPLVAALLRGVYANRGLRYTEHLVFALHLHAFWFIALALTLPAWPWVNGLAQLAMPVYAVLAMRRVYGGRWWALALRTSVLACAYFVLLALVMVAAILWAVLM